MTTNRGSDRGIAFSVIMLGVFVAQSSAQSIGGYTPSREGPQHLDGRIGRHAEVVTYAGGVLSGIEVSAPWGVRTIATLPESAAVIRPYGALLYVLTPESGLVRVLERGGNVVGSAFVDPESEPVDIAPIGDGVVYVSTAADGRVTRLELGGGIARSFIDLHELDEPDAEPDAGMMIVDRGRLFVQLRRLDDENPWLFDDHGALAVIDLATGTLIDADASTPGVQAIELSGPHPRLKMRIDEGSRRMFVSSSGADSYTLGKGGGIDVVDLDAAAPLGYLMQEEFGNFSAVWPTGATTGFLMFHTDLGISSHLAAYEAGPPWMIDGLFNDFFVVYIEAFVYEESFGRLFVPRSDGRVQIIDAESKKTLAMPNVGGIVSDIEVVRWR